VKNLINLSACPANVENLTALIVYFLTFKHWPPLDSWHRPLFAYGKSIHDNCERRAHFDAGQYVEVFDDEAARKGWCLYKVGCKGPATFSPCPIFLWNTRTSWPIGAGHPCIGCTEPFFWDTMAPFYGRLPNVAGFGIESKVDLIGASLALGATAGVVAHAAATGLYQLRHRKDGEERLPAGASADAAATKTKTED